MVEAAEGVVLDGLDGGTAVGFLAGLGALLVLDDHDHMVSLSWRQLDAWRPVLHGVASIDEVVDAVHEDARAWESAPILQFRYLKHEKNGPKEVRGLRAPLGILREWLRARRSAGDEGSLRYACALMCEVVSEPIEASVAREALREHGIKTDDAAPLDRVTLPTFFDFTSRNAQFLDQAAAIRAHLRRDVVNAGLTRGLLDPSAPRTLDWCPGADTPAAIYTGFTGGFLPVAEWLAFRGLVAFPLAGSGSRLETTACSGRRKQGELVWPLWEVPARSPTIRSLVSYPELVRLDPTKRAALGIASVRRSALTKQADGKTGMFSPSQPV